MCYRVQTLSNPVLLVPRERFWNHAFLWDFSFCGGRDVGYHLNILSYFDLFEMEVLPGIPALLVPDSLAVLFPLGLPEVLSTVLLGLLWRDRGRDPAVLAVEIQRQNDREANSAREKQARQPMRGASWPPGSTTNAPPS